MKFLKIFVLLFIVLPFWSCEDTSLQPTQEKLNILFLFSDDHAVQAIGAYGSKINKTPNLDRIADKGVVFMNSFCANSICGPSRACILTGKHSHKNGFKQNGDQFDGSQVTFPKLLKKAGYETAIIGKWHLKSQPTGFDYWEVLVGQGKYYNPDFITTTATEENPNHYEGYCTTIVTDLTLEWLKNKRDPSKPFMLMCQHKAPHRNWAPDIKYLTKYDDVDIPEPATLFDNWENRSVTLKANEMSIKEDFQYEHDMVFHEDMPAELISKRPTNLPAHIKKMGNGEYSRMTDEQKKAWDAAFQPKNDKFLKNIPTGKALIRWKYQRYIKNYLRCIDSVDENIGRVLDYLEENDLMKNTIVIYSSDQGFYLGEHGWFDKRWMYEESLKMPLIVSWPGLTKPGTKNTQHLIQNIDYNPTFLDIAGVKVPKDIQGQSFKSILENPNAPWRESIYYHYYENPGWHNVARHEGVRGKRYKLINFYDDDGYNLHDLKKDPLEMKDVSKDPAYAYIMKKMKLELAQARKQYNLPPLQKRKKN